MTADDRGPRRRASDGSLPPWQRLAAAAQGLATTIAATEQLIQERADLLRNARAVVGRDVRNGHPGGEGIISLAEAARRTGRHPEVLRRWCIEGRIPAIRVGRTWAISTETLATLRQHGARSRPRLERPPGATR